MIPYARKLEIEVSPRTRYLPRALAHDVGVPLKALSLLNAPFVRPKVALGTSQDVKYDDCVSEDRLAFFRVG